MKSKQMTPALLAKRRLELTKAARDAARKATLLHDAASRAKAAAKAARKTCKLARKAARKAAKKARQRAKELESFLKSARQVAKFARSKAEAAKPVVARKRKAALRTTVNRPVAESPPGSPTPANNRQSGAGGDVEPAGGAFRIEARVIKSFPGFHASDLGLGRFRVRSKE